MQAQQHNHTIYRESQDLLQVEVSPFYEPNRSSPAQNIYVYAYRISIINNSHEECQLLRRSWIIKHDKTQEERIDGEGVVGKQPVIKAGESFEYASFCPLSTPYGNMRGRYQMKSKNRGVFWVKVPLFFFRPPVALQKEQVFL